MNDRIDDVSGVEERPQGRREWSGALRSLVVPVLLVVAIVGALLWFDRVGNDGGAGSSPYGIVELPPGLNTTGESPSSDIGRAAPDFLLTTPEGEELRLSELRGSPVLVNFWASWCAPCRQEMPEIVRAYDRHAADGLAIVGIDLQENAGAVLEFADEFGMDFPIVIDKTGQVAEAWRIGGPVEGIPSSYFIDADGIVRARHYGPLTEEQLSESIAEILNDG